MNIKNIIANLKTIKVIDQNDVFHLDGLPTENIKIYEDFYKFFYKLLEKYSIKHQLKPIYFYIDSRTLCSASAAFSRETYFMKISCAYPIMILDKFNRFSIYDNKILSSKYNSLLNINEFNANSFLIESSMTFTFHHEFRHLIQCDGKEFEFTENTINGFDFNRHLYEFDADRIGSRMVMDYVFDIYERLQEKTMQSLKDLFFLALGSIVITFLLHYFKVINNRDQLIFTEIDTSFYLEEKSHPHTLVRLVNIIYFYRDKIRENYSINISITDLLKYPLEVANLYFLELVGKDSELPNLIKQIFDEFENNLDDINMYNNKLYDGVMKHETLSKIVTENNML